MGLELTNLDVFVLFYYALKTLLSVIIFEINILFSIVKH